MQNTANYSLQQGKQALNLSQVTLDDAEKTLKTLKGFNEQIEKSKSEAEKSLEKVSFSFHDKILRANCSLFLKDASHKK